MTPISSSGPPPHERGLSGPEQEARDSADPNYVYCVVRRNYDMRKNEVWFTAVQEHKIVGQSRNASHHLAYLGDLNQYDRDSEASYKAFIKALVDDGWEAVGSDERGRIRKLRRLAPSP